ncbi:hypothetical protein BX600DRAFT_534159, partial [Xylariales sp. PMI_506]
PPHELRSEKEVCLRSLAFRVIHARYENINPAHPDTCDWLFTTPEFREWQDPTDLTNHNGVLWIKGKPGTGKSTLMKHTLSRCQSDFFSDHTTVAYFFNARGEMLEKTPLGMVRSIVYQLLKQDDALYQHFVPTFREKQRISGEEDLQWSVSKLREYILGVVNQPRSKALLLFIDALDECDESEVRDVVSFLESLSISAFKHKSPLKICLSSRHYPSITMKKVLELVVESSTDHNADIAKYIAEGLRVRENNIEAKILKKADGIFLWVVLVVSLLNKAYDEGRVEAMEKALEDIPSDLESIFSKLLSKDVSDFSETILMLQWVLLSQRPLTPEELFAAVVETTPPAGDFIQRRITTSSKGLIEVRKGGDVKHYEEYKSVQFIHLSVSDFLFRQKRLQKLDPTLEPDPVAASHGRLWARCWSAIEQVDTPITNKKDL